MVIEIVGHKHAIGGVPLGQPQQVVKQFVQPSITQSGVVDMVVIDNAGVETEQCDECNPRHSRQTRWRNEKGADEQRQRHQQEK
jgi:hypothetical protein